jgi:hypothetical protein
MNMVKNLRLSGTLNRRLVVARSIDAEDMRMRVDFLVFSFLFGICTASMFACILPDHLILVAVSSSA